MHDDRKLQAIGLWLLDLMEMTKGGREPPTAHKISLYTEQLAEDFPIGAFTKGSLRAALFEQEYFPAFDTVRTRVRKWWNENKPAAGALIGFDGGPALSESDRQWVEFYYRRRGDHAAVGARQAVFDNLESCIRQNSPNGWKSITGERDVPPTDATEAQKAAVAETIRRMNGGIAA